MTEAIVPSGLAQPSQDKPLEIQGVTIIQNLSLEEFECAVYNREFEKAGQLLLNALRRLKIGAEFIGYQPTPRLKKILYTRFCAAVVTLLVDRDFNVSQEGFDHLASEHAVMDAVFRASIFENSDHMLPQMAENPTETDRNKLRINDGPRLAKFLMTYSLRSGFSLNFEEAFKANSRMIFSLWCGMISPLLTIATQAQERRDILLGLHHLFIDVEVPDAVLPSLSDAYMYASYGTRRDKHATKGTIHKMLAKMMYSRGAPMPSAQKLSERRALALDRAYTDPGFRPTMLVCIEWFTSLHAMFRCYAPMVRQMRTKFKLICMSRAQDIDDAGKAEFDEWYEVPAEQLVLSHLVERINNIAPDIIWHPSLGMALWWTVLASVRLAPIQFATLGHPASSQSPCMDYMLCDEGVIGDPALFTEKIVEYPHGSARFVMRHDAVFPAPRANENEQPDVIKIAVPAMLCKLNATFLSTLQQVQARAKRKVEFHFFVNMIGVNLFQAAQEIRDWIPDARTYERNNYVDYLKHMNECHIHCSPFPFGGTNGNIDSMKLGIPIVTLWGDEPHERYDGMMLRRAGMPQWLISRTKDEYIETTVNLIESDVLRNTLRDQLRKTDLDSIFFGEPALEHKTAIVDIVGNLFINHESLRHEPA